MVSAPAPGRARTPLVLLWGRIAPRGVLLSRAQAYMLGAAASEIAKMDAKEAHRTRKLDAIKQYLLSLRVPSFLRRPIMEYYENLYMRDYDDTGILNNMPSCGSPRRTEPHTA
eukprot:7090398-Prymnesium_polylepis.1